TNFEIMGSSATVGISTLLFFESIDTTFIEPELKPFVWEKGSKSVPIIISKDFIALYNFGFAKTQGLPQFSEKTISRFNFTLTAKGNGRRQQFRGRIVGFSDRINSLLVPREFTLWANEQFGAGNASKTSSRLIMKVNNPQSRSFKRFLKEKGYERSRANPANDAIRTALNGLTLFLGFLGLSIFGLSVLILLLSYRLVIARSSLDITRLMEIGYNPNVISQFLSKRYVRLFIGMVLLSIILLQASQYILSSYLEGEQFTIPKFLSLWTLGIAAVVLLATLYFPKFIKNKILEIGH
ncbi:MAG: hypothetical protein AAFV80_19610, partial [Bacteroidota bacterium]